MADVTKQVQCRQFAATTSSGGTPIFLGGVKKVIIQNLSNDIYLDVDQPIATSTAFRIPVANTSPFVIELDQGLITNLYIQAQTGTSTVSIMAIAG